VEWLLVKAVSDEDLVMATKTGNRGSFASLILRHATAMRAVAFHLV